MTANKAMLAHHGVELAAAAETAGTALKYEAAVAGGIPVIKGLREGAAANVIHHVYGVLNGTSLNAADFMIAPSLALIAYRLDLRAEIEARPAGALLERVLPEPVLSAG